MRPDWKTLLTVCILLIASASGSVPLATAQVDARSLELGGAGYFSGGATYLTGIDNLNDALSNAGYPESNRIAFAVGGGGYGVLRNRLMLGGEGHGLIVTNEPSNAREASYAAGMGFFIIGHQSLNVEGQILAYPFVGIGGGGATLAIEHTGAERFGDVLANPDRGATLVQGSLLLQIGGGIELRGARAATRGGPFVGLRAGYVFSAASGDWAFDEGDELRGGPNAEPSGLYLRLVVGGGGPQRVSN